MGGGGGERIDSGAEGALSKLLLLPRTDLGHATLIKVRPLMVFVEAVECRGGGCEGLGRVFRATTRLWLEGAFCKLLLF